MFGVLLSILAHETTTSKYLHRPMKLVFVYGYSPIEYIADIPTFLCDKSIHVGWHEDRRVVLCTYINSFMMYLFPKYG